MKRVIQTTQQPSSNTYNVTTKKVYTRFHRKPQIYQSSFQTNKTYKVIDNLEKENINTLITNIYKEKKYRGVLDLTSPNNKNICIDTDSEHQKSEKGSRFSPEAQNKKSTKLLIAKTESQFPETYNSLNVFRRDGLVRGYYVKVSENRGQAANNYNTYNTMTGNGRMVRTYIQTPSPEHEDRMAQDYNLGAQTQIRTKKINIDTKNIDRTYNRHTIQRKIFRREMDLDEWPSVEKQIKYVYRGNKDIQIGEKVMKTDNSNYSDYKNINQAQNKTKKYPAGMVYRRTNMSEMRASYSQSHISDMSEDLINQYKRQQINENNNYIIAGNTSEIASPKEYRNNNDIIGTSEEESDHRTEVVLYRDDEYQNYMNKNIIPAEPNQEYYTYRRNNNIGKDIGGKVDLDLDVYNKKSEIRTKKIIIKKSVNIKIEEIIRRDERKLNSLIKLQRFIRSYLYLRELCAMKIQAIWRGGNTRKIMDLYNDLDEFIYHLSKVQFNHFNSNFCYFINQLFQVYKLNVSNGNGNENEDESDDNNNMENEEEENEENENCMNQISMEEMEQRENEYLYKFPEGSYFDSDKLIPSNKINIFVGGSMSKDYEKLRRQYEELCQQMYELKQRNNVNINYNVQTAKRKEKKDKNESESTIGSIRTEYKFKFGSISRDANSKVNSESRPSVGDNGKNTISNDENDADLDNNGDDDFFNQELSYDDKDNSGSLKDKIYSYFSIHSDENSKYFDNENPRGREKDRDREGETRKITTSKTSGELKFNNTEKYSGFSSRYSQSKLVGLHRYDKNQKNYSNSPSLEKSNNYIGHHSKTFPRRYNYNDSINNNIIIKHEEDFGIINNNNLFLSPKEREESKHKKNILSDIAITPIAQNIKMEEKNWNDIITYFKNEEIEIQTDKRKEKSKNRKDKVQDKDKNKEKEKRTKDRATEITTELFLYENEPISNEQFHLENTYKKAGIEQLELEQNVSSVSIIKNKIYKKPRKLLIRKGENINLIGLDREFESLEKEYIEELIIDNNDFKKKKMEQIYIEHENELNISSERKNISERKSLKKELKEKENENLLLKKELENKDNKYSLIESQMKEKDNENSLLKKKLENMMKKMTKPKAYDTRLEINNNLNSLNIAGIKPQFNEMLINKITEEETKVSSEYKLNEQLKTLLEDKLKKDREWNNLVINKTKRIDLKGEELKSKKPQEEDIKDKDKDRNKESQVDAPPEKEQLKLRIAIKKKTVSRKKKVKEYVEKEYRNVEEQNIEERKDKKETEVTNDKDNKKVFGELQPHIQDNIRFSFFDKNKQEDSKSLTSSQNLEISSISKNDGVSIGATNERKIKISTKKVVRKNIIHHQFKNNEIVQENELNIDGLRKKKNILEPESQNNNRFTVEKSSVSDKNKNVENCIQINIEGIHEDKDKDKVVLEKIINQEITIVSKPKEVISLVAKNNEFSIEKTRPAITEKITDTSDLKQGQNNEIISENELYINALRKKKVSLEPHSQENNRFTIEKVLKEVDEAKETIEPKYEDETKLDNEIKENDENKTKKEKKKKKGKKHKKKKDKKEDMKDLETQDNVNEADNNLVNIDETEQEKVIIENQTEIRENQYMETQEPEAIEDVDDYNNALRGKRIKPEELQIAQQVEYSIAPSEEKVQEKINEIISNNKKENLKSLAINKNDEVCLTPSQVFKREIKIVTRKTLKKTERIYSKFLSNKAIVSQQNQIDIKGREKKPDDQDNQGRIPSSKIDETIYYPSKVEPKEKEESKTIFKNNEISKNNEFIILGIQKPSSEALDAQEDIINKDKDNELVQSQESKESKDKQIRINQKKVIRKTNVLPSEFTRNNEVINESKINLNGHGRKFDNIQLQNEEDKNNNRFSIQKDTKKQLLNKLSQIKPQENVFFEIEKNEKVPHIYEIDNKGPNVYIKNEDKADSKEKENINNNNKYNNIINIKNRFTIQGNNELIKDKKQYDLKVNDAFRKPINNVINKKSQFTIISKKPEENIINAKSQFSLKGQNKKPEENIINTKSQFTLKGQNKKPEENIINTKSQFALKGQTKKPEENIINTKSQFTLKAQNKKPEENIINTKSQFTINGVNKKPEENIMNIKSQFAIKASNRKSIDNIINTKSQFTINGTNKKPKENIINTKSKFTIKGIQKEPIEVKEAGIQFEDSKDRLSDKSVDTSDLNSKEIRITMKKTVRKTNIFKNDFNNNEITSENKINIGGIQKPQIFNEEKLVKDTQQNEFEISKDPKKAEEEKLKKLQEINNAMEEQRFEINIEKEEESGVKSAKEPISSKKDWNDIIKEDIQQNKFIIKKVKKPSDKKDKEKEKEKEENIKKGKTQSDMMSMIISTEVIIDCPGKQSEIKVQKLPEKKEVTKDWNDQLKEEIQHNKFIIKRISKNIYNKLSQLKDTKDSKDKEDVKEPIKIIEDEKIDSQKTNKDDDNEQIILRNKQTLQSMQQLLKERDWTNTLKAETQQGKFIIKGTKKSAPAVSDTLDQPEQAVTTLRSRKDIPSCDNRIVKKIRFNIEANKYNDQQKKQPSFSSNENIVNQNNWKDSLKEDVQQNKFMIKKTKAKAKTNKDDKLNEEKEKEFQRLKEIEKQNEINKSKIEVEKNIEINLEPIDVLPLAKSKIMDNWKESISKEKSEEVNIEKLPPKREIKIVTRRTLKKVENYYRKFNNLNTAQEQINIEGKQKPNDTELSSENSHIILNINKSYEPKKECKLFSEKNNELFIHSNKKKEIKISTKKVFSKHIHSRFNNISVSDESKLNIEGNENKTSFGNDKLEKIENEKITINNIYDRKKEEELKEKLQKETEELQDKLKKDNQDLQNKIKENDELVNKLKEKEDLQNKLKDELKEKLEKEKENEELQDKLNKEKEDLKKENEELKYKLEKDSEDLKKEREDLKKENEELKDKLEKEKENEELRKKFNNLNITQEQINIDGKQKTIDSELSSEYSKISLNINKSYEPKKEYELTSEKNNELFINSTKKKEIKITTKRRITKTNFIHSRFGNDKLEKIENEKITIDKTYDGKKEEELKEKLQKETEELQDKLKRGNEDLQNKTKENEDLLNKLKEKEDLQNKQIDELKDKLEKDTEKINKEKEELKKENEELKDKLKKEKENEELRKKFNNLNIAQEQINIEGKQKIIDSELSSENSQISLNINKSYGPKKEYELISQKNNELFIGSKKEKEIKISTKKVFTKHIHSKFNNISISNEDKLNIEGIERKTSFGNDKLEKIENEKITINNIYDRKKEEELKEKLQKETEELQDKLKKDNQDLQNKIKENDELVNKLKEKEDLQNKLKDELKEKLEKEKENEELQDKLNKEKEDLKKENEELKYKLEKDSEDLKKEREDLKKENEELKDKLEKEKENEELRKKFNNLYITKDEININKSYEPKKEYELTSEKNNELFIDSTKKKEIKITTKRRITKTNFVHSRFGNDKLEVIENGNLTIDKTYDGKKEEELKEKLEKENEELQDKLRKDNENLKNKTKENEDLANKLRGKVDLENKLKDKLAKEKENEELQDILNKEKEELKKENEELKDKLEKEKENEELRKKFNNLNITKEQININKSYEPKKEYELITEKNNELFIGSNKKKEIKITTKKRYTKTNFIHSRFNNTSISNESKINIERDERKQKEIEELQDKLKKDNEELKNKIKENVELENKLKDKLKKEKENEELQDKLKKENEGLQNRIKENEELSLKFNNLNITQNQLNINNSYEPKKENEFISEKNNELFIHSNKKKEIKITTKKRYTKTNYIHSRFNNTLISDEGKLNIEGDDSKQKVNEEKQDKLKRENEDLQNRIKENEEMKDKLGKDNEVLKKELDVLKDKLQKEKEKEELNDKIQKQTKEFKNENTLLNDKIKEIKSKQSILQKENDELKNKIELEKQKNKQNDKFKKETEDLKKENQKLKEELQKGHEKDNEQLKEKMKENEDLHDKISQNNKMLDKLQKENEEMNQKLKELTKENNELKDSKNKDNEDYSLDKKQLCNEQVQKPSKLTKLENTPKKEEKEKNIDLSDSHKKKLIINTKKIIKKTNVVKHSFTDNEVCSNVQLNINEKKIKEKPKSNLGLLEVKQNENIIIKQNRKKNLGNNIINKVLNIQLLNDKVQKSPDDITDKSFGDNYQLRNVKLQKSNQLTDKSQDVSEMGLYQTLDKNKSETDKSASYPNKGIDNEIDKEKSINIKTIKGKNINNLINQRYNNEDYSNSDSVNIDDKNISSIEPNSSVNLTDEIKSGDKKKKIKVKHIKKKINTTKYEINEINTNKLKLKSKDKKEKEKDTTKKSDNYNATNKNTQSITSNTLTSDDNINLISSSSIETDLGKRTSIDKDVSESDNLDKSKKKNIIINKKVSIITKKNKNLHLESTKTKFFERKQMIKFWKAWKEKVEKKKQKENEKLEMTNSLNQKKTKKPFILKINKVSIKKKILELPKTKVFKQKIETQEKIVSLRSKLLIRSKALMMRHFFSKWKMDTQCQNNIIVGTNNLRYILRRYIIRYLILKAKIIKFRIILIKYSLRSHKNK